MKRVKRTTTFNKSQLKKLDPFFSGPRKLKLENINTIVLHWTGGSTIQPAIDTLKSRSKDSKNPIGYHFLIDKDGTVVQTANLDTRMGHAGESYGPKGEFVNNYAIGISFVHYLEVDSKGIPVAGGKEDAWTDEQIAQAGLLISELRDIEGLNLEYITGHHEISPGRKVDPFSFPFERVIDISENTNGKLKYWKAGDAPYSLLDPKKGEDKRRIDQFNPKLKDAALSDLSVATSDLKTE